MMRHKQGHLIGVAGGRKLTLLHDQGRLQAGSAAAVVVGEEDPALALQVVASTSQQASGGLEGDRVG
jgi:hypothetical protein